MCSVMEGGCDMNKKIWSIVVLCILAALLVFLCFFGVVTAEKMDAVQNVDPSNDVLPGASFVAGVFVSFSLGIGFAMVSMIVSFVGFSLSCLNMLLAPNQIVKVFSIGFLVIYSVPAILLVIGLLGFLL